MIKEKAHSKISQLKSIIEKSGLNASSIVLKEYNYEFDAIQEGKRIKVLLYFGKKGLKLIVQGDQKSSLYNLVNSLVSEQPTLALNEQKVNEPAAYIGTDEAGKGDIFGPLVIAAVYVNEETKDELYRIGVRDSKDLSDTQIDILAAKIKKICKNHFSLVEFKPELYNHTYERYKNLNKLLSFGHSKAIRNLLDDIDAITVISDKFGNRGLEIHSDKAFSHVEFIDTEKAERFVGVAAASILARNCFNQWFYKHEELGVLFPKGASEKAQSFLKMFVKQNDPAQLKHFTKLHFKTIKQYMQ
ncbi:MAG: ribonuclease HIII [Ignavibacteriales bacterium]|nr:ribonuclease HIII [Ignavibacteriales bacterium]